MLAGVSVRPLTGCGRARGKDDEALGKSSSSWGGPSRPSSPASWTVRSGTGASHCGVHAHGSVDAAFRHHGTLMSPFAASDASLAPDGAVRDGEVDAGSRAIDRPNRLPSHHDPTTPCTLVMLPCPLAVARRWGRTSPWTSTAGVSRRGLGADAGRGVPRAPRGVLPGGTAGVPPPRLGGLAATARGGCHKNTISRAC
jgi:hypothetical protein